MSDTPRTPQGLPIPIPRPEGCPGDLARQIEAQLLDRDLSTKASTALFERLRDSAEGQRYYNELSMAVRALEAPERLGQPSAEQLQVLEEQILRRCTTQERKTRKPWLVFLAAMAAVAAAALLALPYLRGHGPPPAAHDPGTFTPRGSAENPRTQVALRAFCITLEKAEPRVAELNGTNRTCPLTATLKLSYTNRADFGFLFVVGVDSRGEPLWYLPTPPSARSVAIKRGTVDEPLPRATRLAVNHQKGPLKIFALFSRTAIKRQTIQVAIEKVGGTPLDRLKQLPIRTAEQRALLVTLGD